jgi:hypothetical protein
MESHPFGEVQSSARRSSARSGSRILDDRTDSWLGIPILLLALGFLVARDLSSSREVPTESLRPQMEGVARWFDSERWQEFVADNGHFLEANPPYYMNTVRRDHGFNPSPAWTFVARLFNANTPLTRVSLVLMAGLDVLLMIAAFALVFRTFGAKVGCAALVLLGLGYAGRYFWIGGSFLRMDCE